MNRHLKIFLIGIPISSVIAGCCVLFIYFSSLREIIFYGFCGLVFVYMCYGFGLIIEDW